MSRNLISRDHTLLDIIRRYPGTQEVFRNWDERAGECLMCNALFEPLGDAAARYGLDLAALTAELEEAAAQDAADG